MRGVRRAGVLFISMYAACGFVHAGGDGTHPGDNPFIVGTAMGLLSTFAAWFVVDQFSRSPSGYYKGARWVSGLLVGLVVLGAISIFQGQNDPGFKSFALAGSFFFSLPHLAFIWMARSGALKDEAKKATRDKGSIALESSSKDIAKRASTSTPVPMSEADKAVAEEQKRDQAWRKITAAISKSDFEGLKKLTRSKSFPSISADGRLLVASLVGDSALAKASIVDKADPNCAILDDGLKGLNGLTPLMAAVGISHSVEVTALLLESGADPNLRWKGQTALFEAMSDTYLDLAELLIRKGANANVQSKDGMTPLMYAARNGARECVRILLEAGADINTVENQTQLGAFGWAVNKSDFDLAKELLRRGANASFGAIETLPLAIAERGDLAFAQDLVQRGCQLVRPDMSGRTAFVAARNPDPEVFDYFLSLGADPKQGNDYAYTPLILATLNSHPSLVRRYLERGDDAGAHDIDGETALSLAVEMRHEQVVVVLREFHVEESEYPEVDATEAMFKAAADGRLGSILNLRDAGVCINSKDEQGNTPLILAAKAGHNGVLRTLYHLGADINHRNQGGETAISIAKDLKHNNIVSSLQEFGAVGALSGEVGEALAGLRAQVTTLGDMMSGRRTHPYKDYGPYEESDTEEEEVETPERQLLRSKLDALQSGLDQEEVREHVPGSALSRIEAKLEKWRDLLEKGDLPKEDVAAADELLSMLGSGKSEVESGPLLVAIQAKKSALINKLIAQGADVNEVGPDGYSALTAAIVQGDMKTVELLLNHKADINKVGQGGVTPLFAAIMSVQEDLTKSLLDRGASIEATSCIPVNGINVGGCSPLYGACITGRVSLCKLLLDHGAPIDQANDLGYTPLMAAIEAGHAPIVDLLLKSGASPETKASNAAHPFGLGGSTPLYSATRKGDVATIKRLLGHGANVDTPSANGWTPLKCAAHDGNLAIVKLLLEAGAGFNIADTTNYTPLMSAASQGRLDIVKLLVKSGAETNVQSTAGPDDDQSEVGRTALADAAASGNVAIARELLQAGANPNLMNGNGFTALHSAVMSKKPEMVATLLKAGSDPNVFGNREAKRSALDITVFQWAKEDSPELVDKVAKVLAIMLKEGRPSDLSSLNEVALKLILDGKTEIVDVLKKHQIAIDPNGLVDGIHQLLVCVLMGDDKASAAKLLLKMGADPNCQSPVGLPALSLAARQGAKKIAELLLRSGADVMFRSNAAVLAYDLAVVYGHKALAKLLMKHMNGVVTEIDVQDEDGCTALFRAVMTSDASMIQDLLRRGACTSRRNLKGETPLSYAVMNDLGEQTRLLRSAGAEQLESTEGGSDVPIVKAADKGALGTVLDLLESGASVNQVDANGESAVTIAAIHPGLIKVLAMKGADLTHRNKERQTAYQIAAAADRKLVMQALKEVGSPIEQPSLGFGQIRVRINVGDETVNEFDINADDDLPQTQTVDLASASAMGDEATVCRTLAEGTNPNAENEDGQTPLFMALAGMSQGRHTRQKARNFDQIIDALLVAGADPNLGSIPPLILAVSTGKLHTVNALLRAGADVNSHAKLPNKQREGETNVSALTVAVQVKDAASDVDELIPLALLSAGAEVVMPTESEETVLHLAAAAGMTQVVKELLIRSPNLIDFQDAEGMTPLMRAAAHDRSAAVQTLLSKGARKDLVDAKGRSVKDVAEQSKSDSSLQALLYWT